MPSSELYVPLNCQEEDCLCVAPLPSDSKLLSNEVSLRHADIALLSIHTCNIHACKHVYIMYTCIYCMYTCIYIVCIHVYMFCWISLGKPTCMKLGNGDYTILGIACWVHTTSFLYRDMYPTNLLQYPDMTACISGTHSMSPVRVVANYCVGYYRNI